MDGIKAGSLRRNKSECQRTQGPGCYLAVHCVGRRWRWRGGGGGRALTALDSFFETRAAHNTLITSSRRRRFLRQTPAAPSGRRRRRRLRLLFIYLFSLVLKPSPPTPNLTTNPLVLLLSFFLFFSAFVHVSRLQPPLSSRLYGEGTSLLAGMDILTGDILWPLAYGNSVKAQPGLIVTSAVLGEVFGEVQA